MLTQEVVQARILGYSERRVMSSTAVVLATGNNIVLLGDASRRAVKCRLDAKVERPDRRTFDFDCHTELLASRPALVVDGLTVLRAFDVAGRPERVPPFGSFPDYDWVRGALVWLGHADPCDTRAEIFENDPKRDDRAELLNLWWAEHQDGELLLSELANTVREKLAEVACRGSWSAKQAGWWLLRNKGTIVGGLHLEQGRKRQNTQTWKVVVDASMADVGPRPLFLDSPAGVM